MDKVEGEQFIKMCRLLKAVNYYLKMHDAFLIPEECFCKNIMDLFWRYDNKELFDFIDSKLKDGLK